MTQWRLTRPKYRRKYCGGVQEGGSVSITFRQMDFGR